MLVDDVMQYGHLSFVSVKHIIWDRVWWTKCCVVHLYSSSLVVSNVELNIVVSLCTSFLFVVVK
jgi:hypothetical protein